MQEINFEQDTNTIDSASLTGVAKLSNRATFLQTEIEGLSARLKEREKELAKIETLDLPELMDSFGMSKFTLTDGTQIEVKSIIRASLPAPSTIHNAKSVLLREELQERLDAGVKYLQDHNAGALVKSVLEIEIGKGNSELISRVIETLEKEFNLYANHNVSVHPMSLSSYVKERLENGDDIPSETFAVFTGRKTSIRQPK